MVAALFWTTALLLGWVYAGFGLFAGLWGAVRRRHVAVANVAPPVSLIIAAYNEARGIRDKIENSLALDYPRELIEMLATRTVGGDEPLHALTREHSASVDVPLRIGRDHVQPEELAAVLAHAAELTDHLARFPLEEPYVVVRKVGDVEILLRLVGRERDAAC